MWRTLIRYLSGNCCGVIDYALRESMASLLFAEALCLLDNAQIPGIRTFTRTEFLPDDFAEFLLEKPVHCEGTIKELPLHCEPQRNVPGLTRKQVSNVYVSCDVSL